MVKTTFVITTTNGAHFDSLRNAIKRINSAQRLLGLPETKYEWRHNKGEKETTIECDIKEEIALCNALDNARMKYYITYID